MNNSPERNYSRKLECPKESRFARNTFGCCNMGIGHMNTNVPGDTV